MSSFCRCCVDPAPASEPFVKGSTEGAALLTGEAVPTRLFELLPSCQRACIMVLLLVSLSLNITVLMPGVPFLILEVQAPLDEFLHPGNYGLGATLNLLKKGHLWGLYILIILFSICFPVRGGDRISHTIVILRCRPHPCCISLPPLLPPRPCVVYSTLPP